MDEDVKQLRHAFIIAYIALFESLKTRDTIDAQFLVSILDSQSKKFLADDSTKMVGDTLNILYVALGSKSSDHDVIAGLFRQEDKLA